MAEDAGAAWQLAKVFLKQRGYGEMYADTLKGVELEDDVWHITAAFDYLGELRRADVWIDSTTRKVIRYQVQP